MLNTLSDSLVSGMLISRQQGRGYVDIISHPLSTYKDESRMLIVNFITEEADRQKLYSVTIGSARFIKRGMAKGAYNYVHRRDGISRFCEKYECDRAEWGLSTKSHIEFVEGLCSYSLNPIHYHAVDNPDYLDAITEAFNLIVQAESSP